MKVQAAQIYFCRKSVQIGKADYGRPLLVLRSDSNGASVCYFSTKIDRCEFGDVIIYSGDPDFKASGLRDTSCIVPDIIDEVNLEFLDGAKYLGVCSGDFKKRVEEWYGMALI